MKEFFSKGGHGEVYRVDPSEKLLFRQADLVKQEAVFGPPTQIYYAHKIAHLLFPNNFIDVVGIQFQSNWSGLNGYKSYSKEAPVSPDHAVFSAHMGIIDHSKVIICECAACLSHREYHTKFSRKNFIKDQLLKFRMQSIGFEPPWGDVSDYCYTPKGILFFELTVFNPDKIRRSISKGRSPQKDRVMNLLDRFEAQSVSTPIKISA